MYSSVLPVFGVLLIFGYLSGTDGATTAATPYQCDVNGLRRFDATVARLIPIGGSSRRFPESKGKDLKIFCDETLELIAQLDKYKTYCMFNMQKQVTGVLIYALKNVLVKQVCKKETKFLDEAIAATPCMNQANAEITKCYTKLIDAAIGSKNAVETKRIPHLCCEYYKLHPCLFEKVTPKKFNKCTARHVEVASDFVRGIVDNVVQLICTDYTEGSDKCEKLEPAPRKLKSQKRAKSIIVPVIELLDSFEKV